ncbi:uncharacterized protein [Antedon mediterranea]|uniref:uncharacterized protein n=1 Tax=Antedon mediterranea TaxID=105859 RepID=UPI003AF62B72
MFPTAENVPRLYCLPKVHKPNWPIRPIVDSINTIFYGVSRYIKEILKPLVGNSKHHVENSKQLAKEIRNINIPPNETLISFDVVSLYTKTPVKEAIKTVEHCLKQDKQLNTRTKLEVVDIIELSLILNATYFSFKGKIYKQEEGLAMGSPISPIIANLFMEWLESEAIATAPMEFKPSIWYRYVDDILASIPVHAATDLNTHLNNIDTTQNIKFTTECMSNNTIPFLDILITLQSNRSLTTSVYRKPTHTDQYLNFKSNHPLQHKLSVINTLVDRCENIVSTPEGQKQELDHIRQALKKCDYPDWSFKKVKKQRLQKQLDQNRSKGTTSTKEKSRCNIGIQYTKGLSERIKRVFNQHQIDTFFIPSNKIRQNLVHPKDHIEKDQVCGCIYKLQCLNCPQAYIGETGRALKTRIKEHRTDTENNTGGILTRAQRSSTSSIIHKSAITDHALQYNHLIDWNAAILEKECNTQKRQIKESINIRKHGIIINRDEGAHELSHIYDQLLEKGARPFGPIGGAIPTHRRHGINNARR